MIFLSQGVLLSSLWSKSELPFWGVCICVFRYSLEHPFRFPLLPGYASYQLVSYLYFCRIFFVSVEELVLERKKSILGKCFGVA